MNSAQRHLRIGLRGVRRQGASHVLAELRRSGKHHVVVLGFNRSPVISMGGLRVLPDKALHEVSADRIGLLILPGGDLWESGCQDEPRCQRS